ncbi:MAG: VaFE repeat-containing surface-anchored protein, partial [Coprobacillaceae bacterium]
LATGINGEKEFDTSVDNTIVDTIEYNNIDTSKEYTLVTEFIHKETGEVVTSQVEENVIFPTSNGEYTITLQIPANTLKEGEYYFAEYLYEENKEHGVDNAVVEHNDSSDKNQTVYFKEMISNEQTAHTGDKTHIHMYISFIGIAIIMSGYTVLKKKKQNN